MFAKFRSRHQRPVTDPEPRSAAPVASSPAVADAEILGRVDLLRAALRDTGFSLDETAGPEPAFFVELRTGCPVELGTAELKAITSHLGGIPASCVLADDAHAELLRRIEAEGIRMELRRDGFQIHACRGDLPDDPDAMRRLSDAIREQLDIAIVAIEADETSPR